MAVKLSPIGNDAPFLDASGVPLNAGELYTYVAGSVSTPETTYTTSLGSVQNANPIILNSNGYPASGGNVVSIWLTSGVSYKFVLKTAAGVTVWSRDNIDGINDTSVSIDEWVTGPAPTFVSAVSFTLVGDQTTNFHEGRRLKTTNSGGTVYSTITGSTFGATTAVTVANDGGASLDSGLSAVSLGLITATNTSISADMIYRKGTAVASAATCDIWNTVGDYIHITGSTGPITSFGTAPYAGSEKTLIFDSTPGITYNATTMQINGGVSVTMAAGDRATVRADTTANMIVTINRANGASLSTPLPRSYLAGCALSNNVADATNDIDIAVGVCRDSTDTANITVAAMTKQLDVNWAPGTAAGLRNSGAAITDTTYHVYAVSKADGTQDFYAHTSTTVATVLTALQAETGGGAYIYARRIGSIVRASAAIRGFVQYGDWFYWKSPPALDVDVTNPGTSAVSRTLSVPVGIQVNAKFNATTSSTGSTHTVYFSSLDTTDVAGSQTATPLGSIQVSATGGAETKSATVEVWTNTSAQIRSIFSSSAAGDVLKIATVGWMDRRGRDA